uniref:Uncharacterized protein n=1 Tax=Panagrolaimus sp. ES5 TaxID=591445 RepID=A0AC34FX88_9BILA
MSTNDNITNSVAVSDEDEILVDVDGVQYPKEEVVISHDPIIFEENVTITLGQPHSLVADGLINFCMGNIHSGNDTFLETHRLSGDELKNACHKFRGVQPGYARTIKKWKSDNPTAIENITIVCELESDFMAFHHQIPAIDTIVDFSPKGVDDFFPSLQYTTQDYLPPAQDGYVEAQYSTYTVNQYPTEEPYEYNENEATRKVDMSMNVERSENMYDQRSLIRDLQLRGEEPDAKEIHDLYQDMFYLPDGGIRLQLSRNLSPTMLPLEEPDGRIRQYRLTTQTKNGEKLAAAGRRPNDMPFIDAVPILIQPDEKTITTDFIQRAGRQFDAETFGVNEEDVQNGDEVKREMIYHPQ